MAKKNTSPFVGKMKAKDLAKLVIAHRPTKPFNYSVRPTESCPGPWSDAVLDEELARRVQSPPSLNQFIRDPEFHIAYAAQDKVHLEGDETVSIDALRVELATTPADHVMREWREWEFALAERAMLVSGVTTFYRVVAAVED